MIVLIASWLGIPLWIIFGILGLKLFQRFQFKNEPDVFEVKIRLETGAAEGFKTGWPRLSGYARWVHDVLLVHEGLGLRSNTPLPVAGVEGPLDAPDLGEAKRLGDNPVIYRLTLDDGATLLMAAPTEASTLAVGPFAKPIAGHQE